MKKHQICFKKEILDVLKSVNAEIRGEDDESWLIHFQFNGIQFQLYYDDGISCYRMSKPFYNPLEWGFEYFNEFKRQLLALRN